MAFNSNGMLEVVFSFDTTGSMSRCLDQVRGRIKDMIQRLQCDIPGIRTAVFAHGDYCDKDTYVTKWIDFTTNVPELCDFVTNIEETGGGDSPECYELVLHQVRTRLSWTPRSRRALVLIGDDEPHGPDYHLNKDKIDWKHETKELALGGVTIYPVQCAGGGADATAFYKTLATATHGKHLKLDDFGNIFDVLMAVCYKEGNDTALLASYEKEVRARCGSAPIGSDIDAIFASLRDGETRAPSPVPSFSSLSSSPSPSSSSAPVTAVEPAAAIAKSPGCKRKHPKVKTPTTRPRARKAVNKLPSPLDRYRQKNLPLLKREEVPETNFELRSLQWSPWILVLSPEKPKVNTAAWVKRRGKEGYRLRLIPTSNPLRTLNRSVLYEISVQKPGSKTKRHVVQSGFSTKCIDNRQWELHSLRRRHGRIIDNLLSEGCRISLRYHLLSDSRKSRPDLRNSLCRYDYAWKCIRNTRNQPRSVHKGGYQISFGCE